MLRELDTFTAAMFRKVNMASREGAHRAGRRAREGARHGFFHGAAALPFLAKIAPCMAPRRRA
ncbi:hypothetical protein [Achromobacter aloeverae]